MEARERLCTLVLLSPTDISSGSARHQSVWVLPINTTRVGEFLKKLRFHSAADEIIQIGKDR